MKTAIPVSIFVVCILLISSCYYDKEELLYPASLSGPCTDTAGAVSYSQKVVPLFQQYCYGCHSGNFPSGNIAMGTYQTDRAIGQNGKLYGSIAHSPGYSPMPKASNKMSNCQVALIKKWIDSGMLNN
ncbi:MAG: hypothetical protein HC867_09255 [Bacteroidia bacterium]|nr:hypothetical protein [Bacteroidia bacterium]